MGRRSAGEGSVYQRKDASRVAQYKGTYRYAKDRDTAKLLKLLTETQEVQPKNITVSKALDDYLQAVKANLKPLTVTRYREAIEVHIKPTLGNAKLPELDALTIEAMYARKLSAGVSPSTVKLIHAVFSSSLEREVRLTLTTHNVCKDLQTPAYFS